MGEAVIARSELVFLVSIDLLDATSRPPGLDSFKLLQASLATVCALQCRHLSFSIETLTYIHTRREHPVTKMSMEESSDTNISDITAVHELLYCSCFSLPIKVLILKK